MHKSKGKARQFSANTKALILISLLFALELIFQMIAIQTAIVAYVISIKFTSIIISVLFGYFMFKETRIRERLLGASVMLLGILLITLF
jgi:uncharacterized membrane protein